MSFKAEPLKKKANYYTIKEASFRLPSNREDPEAIRREYTNPKTKEDGVAYERAYRALFGIITGISFTEKTLTDDTTLRSINVTLGEDDDGIQQVISLPVDSRFTSDFLKKLPNIHLTEEVRLMPYDFEPKEGPRQVGISITQRNTENGEFTVKVHDFFVKKEEKDGKTVFTNLHGYPEPTDEDSEDWPFYFRKVNKFLISYAKENIIPKLGPKDAGEKFADIIDATKKDYPTDDINPDDIPF